MVLTVSSSSGAKNSSFSRPSVPSGAVGDRGAREIVLHDDAENGGLQMLPFALALGHADEVGAEEHALDALDLEQTRGKRRGLARLGIEKLQGAVREHGPARKELQGRGVWGCFGLDEHGSTWRRTANLEQFQ